MGSLKGNLRERETQRGVGEGKCIWNCDCARRTALMLRVALQMWIFDQPDHSGRLLKGRQGHSAPPMRIQFYGEAHHGNVNTW